MDGRSHRGWYKHGKLPHFDEGGLYQSITYRLNDSLPQTMLRELEGELKAVKAPCNVVEMERRKRMERWLDAGYGSCVLGRRENAELVLAAWDHFDGERYDLIAGVVMPNHVHILVRIYPGVRLGDVVASWKGYTSRRFVVEGDGVAGVRWQRGYWDRFMRNEAHYRETIRYILDNPVKAGLVRRVEEWPYRVGGAGRSVGLQADT